MSERLETKRCMKALYNYSSFPLYTEAFKPIDNQHFTFLMFDIVMYRRPMLL